MNNKIKEIKKSLQEYKDTALTLQEGRFDELKKILTDSISSLEIAKCLDEYDSYSMANASRELKERVELINFSIQICQRFKSDFSKLILKIDEIIDS
jgi:phage tail tape-measure protein